MKISEFIVVQHVYNVKQAMTCVAQWPVNQFNRNQWIPITLFRMTIKMLEVRHCD